MNKIIIFATIALLTCFTGTNGKNAFAGGCNTHMNKNAKIECSEDDAQCLKNTAKNHELEKTVRS